MGCLGATGWSPLNFFAGNAVLVEDGVRVVEAVGAFKGHVVEPQDFYDGFDGFGLINKAVDTAENPKPYCSFHSRTTSSTP